MSDPLRWKAYEERQKMTREDWYCDVRVPKEQWVAMSVQQRRVYQRWKKFYQQRRALRELCRGGG